MVIGKGNKNLKYYKFINLENEMNKFSKLIAAVALSAFAGAASAVSIVGAIGFSSVDGATWDAVDSTNTITSIAAATGIKFNASLDPSFVGVDQAVRVATGSFAGTVGENVNFFDFQFDPLAAASPLWAFSVGSTDYSFNMNAVSTIQRTSSTITLTGTGYMDITGFDTTYGTWDFSGNAFTFSASSAPEPALALLLATGLIGFGFAHRARKA